MAMIAFVAVTACGGSAYYGVTDNAVETDGTLLSLTEAFRGHSSATKLYASTDGGWTWEFKDIPTHGFLWESTESVDTPRGTYYLEGADLVLNPQTGDREIVYSTANWTHDAHLWLQGKLMDAEYLFVAEPYGIAYHEQSGNLILAVGVRGVVVGTPDGQWIPAGVGEYLPADFSPLAKTLTLLSDPAFWILMFLLALSFTLFTLALSAPVRSVCAIAVAVLSVGTSSLAIIPFGILVIHNGSQWSVTYQGYPELYQAAQWILIILACSFAVLPVVAYWHQLRQWRVVGPVLIFMLLIMLGVFIAWIQTAISLPHAKLLAIGLMGLTSLICAIGIPRNPGPPISDSWITMMKETGNAPRPPG